MDGATAVDGTGASAVGLKARNETLKTWIPKEESLDALLDKKATELVSSDTVGYAVRVAYQQPIMAALKAAGPAEALANTFEDAIVYETPLAFVDKPGAPDDGLFEITPAGSAAVLQNAGIASPSFVADRSGAYVVELTVTDSVDASARRHQSSRNRAASSTLGCSQKCRNSSFM